MEGLEKISAEAAARLKERSVDPRRMEEFWAKVRAWHAVPENQAWVAAQPPGWLGIQVRELRAHLMARAKELCINKYFI
jgi:hypothetical protein